MIPSKSCRKMWSFHSPSVSSWDGGTPVILAAVVLAVNEAASQSMTQERSQLTVEGHPTIYP
jgi:hypothetical protein